MSEEKEEKMDRLQIKVTKDYSVPVPGGTKCWKAGCVLWEDKAPPPEAASNRDGLHPDGWMVVMGHGWQEVIPKGHLEINRFEYARNWSGPVPWDEVKTS